MKQFDAVVIGSGPGGYVCAIRLAQLGKKTAVIEKENVGGVCLNVGCIPSKALIYASSQYHKLTHDGPEMGINARNVSVDVKKMQEWKAGVVKKLTGGVAMLLKQNGVELIKGNAVLKSADTLEVGGETVQAKNIVIATGSRVVEIPSLKFNGKTVLDSTQALALTEVPKKLVVIGGGFIGVEIGTVYAKLGAEVTIVEALDAILGTVDQELVRVVEKRMRALNMKVYTKTKALGVKEKTGGLTLDIETPEGKKSLDATHILVSVGRKPNSDGIGLEKVGVKTDPKGNIAVNQEGKTNVPGIYAIGDVSGAPQLAHRASMDGLIVAANIAGEKAFKDYKTVPWAIFCDPEIAVCGLTEAEAKALGFQVKSGKFPFAANGRALSTNEGEGFIKVLVDEKTEQILGVHIVGPEASNLIAEAALAIEMGATAEDVVRTIHTHPTLPEAFPEAVEAAVFKPIHIYKPAPRAGARPNHPAAHA